MSQDSGCAAPSSSPASLTVDAARRLIFDRLTPVGGYERIALRAALGRILAEPVIAPCNVPAHDNSAMDGYAIRVDYLP